MAFWHQLGTKPIGKRVLLLPEPRPGPLADPKIICHPEAGNTKYIPLSGAWDGRTVAIANVSPSRAMNSTTRAFPPGVNVHDGADVAPLQLHPTIPANIGGKHNLLMLLEHVHPLLGCS